jgi:F0F1-type ATP synthase beta subunit
MTTVRFFKKPLLIFFYLIGNFS